MQVCVQLLDSSRHACRFTNSPTEKYFHYLTPVEPVTSTEENIWQGKLVATMKHMDRLMEEQEKKAESRLTSLKNEVIQDINAQLREILLSHETRNQYATRGAKDPGN